MKKIIEITLTDTHLQESTIEKNWTIYRETVKFAKSVGITTISHLGDVFQSRKSQSQLVLNTFQDILDYLESEGVSLLCIHGNHDCVDHESERSFLDCFKGHKAFTLIPSYYNYEVVDGIVLHYLSYFSNEKYLELVESIVKSLDHSKINILNTHIGIQDAQMNNGMRVEGISQSLFKSWTLTKVGHYHDPQVLSNNIHYIGSSLQTNFGELPEKGFTITYSDLSLETVELNYPKFRKLEVDVNRLTTTEIEEFRRVRESTDDNLRVVLCGTESEVKSFNKQLLLNIGIGVETKIDKISIEEIEENVEAFTPESLIESFKAFCTKNELDVEEGSKFLLKSLNK